MLQCVDLAGCSLQLMTSLELKSASRRHHRRFFSALLLFLCDEHQMSPAGLERGTVWLEEYREHTCIHASN